MTYLAPISEVKKLIEEGWAIQSSVVVENNKGLFVLMCK